MHKFAMILLTAYFATTAQAQTFGATKPIWQQRSMYRNIIVLEGHNHRCLTFGKRSNRQSCINLESPKSLVFDYTQRIFSALGYIPKLDRILIIGIGGGSLPMAIRESHPETHIDAVELDQEVVNVALRFFQFKPDEKLSVFTEDGRVFIRKMLRQNIKYDAIILDAFDKDYIPEHMTSAEFINQAKHTLTENGIILANTFKSTNFAKYEEATYQAIFGDIYESVIPNGNRIIIAGRAAASVAENLPTSQKITQSKAAVMTDKYSPANALLAR